MNKEELEAFFDRKMNEISQKILRSEENIKCEVQKITEICQKIQVENQQLKETVSKQQEVITSLQKLVSKRNVIIHGLEETEDDLETDVSKMMHEKLKVSLKSEDVEEVFRIGKKSNRTRPVKLVFASLKKRQEVFKVKSNLKGSEIYINEDLPFEIRKQRQAIRNLRNQNTAVVEKTTNKRLLSVSPQSSSQRDDTNRIEQDGKKLKKAGNEIGKK